MYTGYRSNSSSFKDSTVAIDYKFRQRPMTLFLPVLVLNLKVPRLFSILVVSVQNSMGNWDYLGTVGTCPRCRRSWMLKLLGIPQTDHPLYLLPMPIHPANGGFFWYLRLSLFQSTGVNERMTLNLLEKIVAEGAVWCSCSVRGQWVMSAWAMHLLSYIVFCVFGLKIIVIPYLALTVS